MWNPLNVYNHTLARNCNSITVIKLFLVLTLILIIISNYLLSDLKSNPSFQKKVITLIQRVFF